MFIALLLLAACAPEERNVYPSPHIAPNGARGLGWALGYKHTAPPEQRQEGVKYVIAELPEPETSF